MEVKYRLSFFVRLWGTLIWPVDENARKAMTLTQDSPPWNIDDVCLLVTQHQLRPASPPTRHLSSKLMRTQWGGGGGGVRGGEVGGISGRLHLTPPCEAVKWLSQRLSTTARGSAEWRCRRCELLQDYTSAIIGKRVIRRGLLYWLRLQNCKLVEQGGSALSPSWACQGGELLHSSPPCFSLFKSAKNGHLQVPC